ncbi:hypothetical protein B0T10DRAFT_464886 [Thelonectria olida]|uniref:Uncharacterized protein n=1 Tax=Thelonectria olida TaxID=1576542 RepID=A0A9P9AMD6_9HYPO|nr:hypothetical protein B0T10DRAFT_464886 [Thelonectria olida]
MAYSQRLQQLLLECIHRVPPSIHPSAVRTISTTASRRAAPTSKPSPPRNDSSPRPKGTRVIRPASTPRASSPSSTPALQASPAQEAIRAAEARESALRAARLRRANQRQEDALEEHMKKEAKKEYTKKYNTAARKWVSSIIALPIFFVTSYYLFDRLALGNAQKTMPRGEEEE